MFFFCTRQYELCDVKPRAACARPFVYARKTDNEEVCVAEMRLASARQARWLYVCVNAIGIDLMINHIHTPHTTHVWLIIYCVLCVCARSIYICFGLVRLCACERVSNVISVDAHAVVGGHLLAGENIIDLFHYRPRQQCSIESSFCGVAVVVGGYSASSISLFVCKSIPIVYTHVKPIHYDCTCNRGWGMLIIATMLIAPIKCGCSGRLMVFECAHACVGVCVSVQCDCKICSSSSRRRGSSSRQVRCVRV